MSQRSRTLKILSALLPVGALGMSIALAPHEARALPKPADTGSVKAAEGVAARLQGIRDAVSTVTASEAGEGERSDANILKVWWRNWHNGWGNGGWRNWGNGWHNWHNGWHNWGNGWRNW